MIMDAKDKTDGSTAKRWIADKPLLFVVSLLLCFGFIMIYSASALEADEKYGNVSKIIHKRAEANTFIVVWSTPENLPGLLETLVFHMSKPIIPWRL